MKCVADVHYNVRRENTARYWQPPNDHGPVISLDCTCCDFRVLKRYTRQPCTSTSGLGRYNRMRGHMVSHLHECHPDELFEVGMAMAEKEEARC